MAMIRESIWVTALMLGFPSLSGWKCRAAERTPEMMARSIYSQRPGDVRRHFTPALANMENSVSPSWMFGGYYPDGPSVRFKAIEQTADAARVTVDIDVDGAHLRRTLHFVRQRSGWIIDRVRLDQPEGRDIP